MLRRSAVLEMGTFLFTVRLYRNFLADPTFLFLHTEGADTCRKKLSLNTLEKIQTYKVDAAFFLFERKVENSLNLDYKNRLVGGSKYRSQ